MKTIKLTNGKFVFLDDCDYKMVKKLNCNWYESERGHAYTRIWHNGIPITMSMHRIILNAPKNSIVDHSNGNGLDNRRENLRFCSPTQNCYNRRKIKNSQTLYKGVSYLKNRNKYRSRLGFNNKIINIGYFHSSLLAAIAYDLTAITSPKEY